MSLGTKKLVSEQEQFEDFKAVAPPTTSAPEPRRLRSSFFVVATITALSFLLIGYDNGVIGGLTGAEAFLDTFGNPDANLISTITSIYEIGCFAGSLIALVIADWKGRKPMLAMGAIIMTIGAALQASPVKGHSPVAVMIVGRVVSGIGMGFINSTAPVLQAEISPKASRGRFACAQLSALNFGLMVTYWMDYGTTTRYNSTLSWRLPLALQIVVTLTILVLVFFAPESPRWLVAQDRMADAEASLKRLYGTAGLEERIAELSCHIEHDKNLKETSWKALLSAKGKADRPRVLIAFSGMTITLAAMAGCTNQIQLYNSAAAGKAAAAMSFLYMGLFTTGFQSTVWVYPPEILPMEWRAKGTALATSTNWIINFAVVKIMPISISNIGWKTYIIFACFNASFVPVIYFFYPETAGKSLEEIDEIFALRSGSDNE